MQHFVIAVCKWDEFLARYPLPCAAIYKRRIQPRINAKERELDKGWPQTAVLGSRSSTDSQFYILVHLRSFAARGPGAQATISFSPESMTLSPPLLESTS